MIVWGAFAIPIITSVVLLLGFKHKTVVWEYLVLFAVSIMCVVAFKFASEKVTTTDTEYWGGWIAQAEYFERWDEEVPCKHTKYCTRTVTRSGSDGRTHTETEQYPCGTLHRYDVDTHPPKWVLTDSNEESQSISSAQFEGLASSWSNRTFVDMRRDYHAIDGDKYLTVWDERDETLVEVTTKHHYENRVQSAASIFNFSEVDPKVWGLYDYPGIGAWDQCAILGNGGSNTNEADKLLRFWNAKLGHVKQVKMFILVFPSGTTLETGLAQENYWRGGNKNEFILAVGIDSTNKVAWAHVISWTEEDKLKIDVRERALSQETLDLVDLVGYMAGEVHKRFERKPFAEFSYLTVEPPTWAVVLSYVLTLLIDAGLGAWIVLNRSHDSGFVHIRK